METIKVKGIVLSSVSLKEKDMLVDIFTLEQGIISAKLKSVKNPTAKLKFAKEIFCFGEFIITNPFNTITSVEVVDTFFDITKDLKKYYVACGVLRVVKTVLQKGEISANLFVETLKCIGSICYDNVSPLLPFGKFLINIFENMGYRLSLDKCADCGENFIGKRYLNLDFGEIVCVGCKAPNAVEISPKIHAGFRILKNTDYDRLNSIKLAQNSDQECVDMLLLNFEKRFGIKINLI